MERAALIATRETRTFLQSNPEVEKVVLVCFGWSAYQTYVEALQKPA
jgi:hypothetical protein